MSSQPLLFEVGPPGLPQRITVFATGANEAREIRGFALGGVSIAVAVPLVRQEAIRELLHSSGHAFADSGAFSEVQFGHSGITDTEWKRRLDIYKRLAETPGSRVSASRTHAHVISRATRYPAPCA